MTAPFRAFVVDQTADGFKMGIKVLGIDMPSTPLQMRRELWEEVMREATLLSLADAIVSEVALEDIPRVTQAMLDGQTRGRILVRPSEP